MISVCIITRDEAPKLKKCLEAIRTQMAGIEHEIVVIDTGSLDNSIAVAHEYTQSVFYFEWCGDFAAAKNYSIEKAFSDYIIHLDTDEYLEDMDAGALTAFFDKGRRALGLIKIRNRIGLGKEERISVEWLPRVFDRRIFHFEGRIHEQLRPISPDENGGGISRERLPISVEHDGYLLSDEEKEKKAARNVSLLKKELESLSAAGDEEKIPYVLYQLGKACQYTGDHSSAAEYFGKALGYDLNEHLEYVIDMVSSYGYALINSGQEERAQDLEGVYEAFSHDADYLFVMGLIYMKNARFDEAVKSFEEATKQPEARIEGVNGCLAWYNTGVIYECLGKTGPAREYYGKCGTYEPAVARLSELDRKEKKKWKVVFLPYKSAMWDSLESVYLACREDDEIEAVVMPIPYFSVDEETGKAAEHMDTSFPEDVPVFDYKEVDLAEMRPDAIFIHNPYDGANNVTSVHPAFYSDKLKACTDHLIYVPYYASPNGLTQGMSVLPAYKNIDYWIVPSERFKEEAAANAFYEKMVALGSPKYDRVIRLSKSRPDCPHEWGELSKEKKRILICSTIASVLAYTDEYIKKYEELFDRLKGRDDIEIIWRPHPLLGSTVRTLRAGKYEKWQALTDFFVREHIGVLDQTGDVSLAIACTDAEIDDGSSMASLYMAAGKPILYFYGPNAGVDSVISFIDGVINDKMNDQIQEHTRVISQWAAYLDGSSGKHIYEWLKGLLVR